MRIIKALLFAGMALLASTLPACGGGGGGQPVVITGPGLVGIDDTSSSTSPVLAVTYTVPPSPEAVSVTILSDLASDGDIEFDPVLNTYVVTAGPSEVLFGEDSSNADLPEFRAFLTFPLDGVTGQPSIPSDAAIVSATLEVYVDQVDFASTVPTFVDLVQYGFRRLSAGDFDAPLVSHSSYVALNFYSGDRGNFVDIDVTGLMQEVQVPPALPDFQVRFGLQGLVTALSRGASSKTGRGAVPRPGAFDKARPERRTSSTGSLARGELRR